MKKYKLIYWLIIVPVVLGTVIMFLYYYTMKDVEETNDRVDKMVDSWVEESKKRTDSLENVNKELEARINNAKNK